MTKTVLIIGTGTIGEPLITLFARMRVELGVDEVIFHKRTPLYTDRSKVMELINLGARLCVTSGRDFKKFREIGLHPKMTLHRALTKATVVIDCTPSGIGRSNKEEYYLKFADNTAGFIAQGSEAGFGKPYAHQINDHIITPKDQFIQVVSCNTHNMASLIRTFGFKKDKSILNSGTFICIRRASDISQTSFIASPTVGKHDDNIYGTHHATDVVRLFETTGCNLNIFSSAVKVPTQYMHVIHFDLELQKSTTAAKIVQQAEANPLMAITHKKDAGTIFSFARDHSPLLGRILNQAIIPVDTLHVDGKRVVGFAFTSQDGNSLLSSIVAAERFLYPDSYLDKIKCLDSLLFDEV